MGGRTGRECPTCDAPIGRTPGRTTARWCGGCGEPLDPAAGADGRASDRPDRSDRSDRSDGEAAAGHRARVASRVRRWSTEPRVAATVAALVLAPLAVYAGLAADQLGPNGGSRLEVDFGRDQLERAVDRPASDDEPVCLHVPDCVVWVEPATVAGRTPVATVEGDLTLVRVHDGLEARDTDTGTLRWRAPLGDAAELRTFLPVYTAAGAAFVTDVATDSGVLRALDLRTGVERWTLHDVDEVSAVRDQGAAVLVQVARPSDRHRSASGRRSAPERIVALDPRTGDELWSRGGDLLHLLDDGAVVVDEGAVTVVDEHGAMVWQRPLDEDFTPAWHDVTGRFLRLYDGTGRGGPTWSLTDGSELEEEGDLVPVADVAEGPRVQFRSGIAALVDRGTDGSTDISLLDGDEVSWTATLQQLGCCAPIQLIDDTIAVPASDGGRWLLARSDGEVLDRVPAPAERSGAFGFLSVYGGVSVEELDATAATTADLAVVENGQRTARVPAGTWPVGVSDEVIVVRSHAWVAAIRRLPDHDAQ